VVVHIDVAADGVVSVWFTKWRVTVCGVLGSAEKEFLETELFRGEGAKGWLAFSMDLWDCGAGRRRSVDPCTVVARLDAGTLWTIWHQIVPCARDARVADKGMGESLNAHVLSMHLSIGGCFLSGTLCRCAEYCSYDGCPACLVEAGRGSLLYARASVVTLGRQCCLELDSSGLLK
jgi:hypothetical protein